MRRGFVLLAVLAAFLGGCGGSPDTPGRADPAAAVPSSAAAYFALDAGPDGARREAAEAALRALTGQPNPAAVLRREVDRRLRAVHEDYDSDVKPWLGRRVGVWAENLSPADGQGAFVAAVRNEDRARDALKKGSRDERELAGTTLYRHGSGQAGIVLDGLAIYGEEHAVRASVDALRGSSLREDPAYREAIAGVDSRALGVGYLAAGALQEAADSSLLPGGASTLEVGLRVLGADPGLPVAFALSAEPKQLALELGLAPGRGRGGLDVADLPDAPVALTLNGLGRAVRRTLPGSELGSESRDYDFGTLIDQLGATLRLDVRRDLLPWVQDAALTYRGHNARDVASALVLTTSDRRAADRAVDRVAGRLLTGRGAVAAPPPARGRLVTSVTGTELGFGRAGRRVLAAVGQDAFTRALHPVRRVGDSVLYRDARRALGRAGHPTALLDPRLIVDLALRDAPNDPGTRSAAPFLHRIRALVAGTARRGHRRVGKLVALLH